MGHDAQRHQLLVHGWPTWPSLVRAPFVRRGHGTGVWRRARSTVAVYAVNEDSGKSGQQVIERLEDFANLEVKVLDSRDEADQRVGKGQRMAAVVVPDDFTAAMTTPEGATVEMIVDPARQRVGQHCDRASQRCPGVTADGGRSDTWRQRRRRLGHRRPGAGQ